MKVKNIDQKWLPYVYSCLLIVAGLLFIVLPDFFLRLFVIIPGIAAVAYGIFVLLPLKDMEDSNLKRVTLIKGCISITFGLLAVIGPMAVAAAAIKIVAYIFAVSLIVMAVLGFYSTSMETSESDNRKKEIFENLALLLIAVILFLISPKSLGYAIIRILGICAIAAGLVWIVFEVLSKKNEIVVADEAVVVKTEEEDK